MKVTLCGMLYRDSAVVLEMLRSTLPFVDDAVFATAPLPYIKPLPDDGTNEMVQEYADRLHKLVTFDDRLGLSHEQQNHVLEHLSDGDYAFWVAADEVARGDIGKAIQQARAQGLDAYSVAYRDTDQIKTMRHYLQRSVDALRTGSIHLALKVTIIKYHQGDRFDYNHWSYFDKRGRLAVQGLYRAVGSRSQGMISPSDLTMVDIAHKRSDTARERRTERYAVLRAHGWDERKV